MFSTIKLNGQCKCYFLHLTRNLRGCRPLYKNNFYFCATGANANCISYITPYGTMQNDKIKKLPQRINHRFQSTMKETQTNNKPPNTSDIPESIVDIKEPSRSDKLKKAVKEYGSTVIVFHVGISLISLGSCYLLVSAGLDTAVVLETLGLQDWLAKSQIAANASTFAVAYAVHKVFAPVRITITLASVPLIVRYLRNIGFLKK